MSGPWIRREDWGRPAGAEAIRRARELRTPPMTMLPPMTRARFIEETGLDPLDPLDNARAALERIWEGPREPVLGRVRETPADWGGIPIYTDDRLRPNRVAILLPPSFEELRRLQRRERLRRGRLPLEPRRRPRPYDRVIDD